MSTKLLITGGAGYFGRGVLRRIQRKGLDWDVTVFSRDETKQDLCRHRFPSARYVLGDVRDTDRLMAVMAGQDAVFHAAALKYIPEAELNAGECLSVNIGGTQSVIAAAKRANVRTVVGISTDKSVQPVNVYGCSKMAMERLFAESSDQYTRFVCVRYGNVVGSTGSVIPFFERQLKEQGFITVTNLNMTRFWMSIEEAINLTVQAWFQARPGAVLIPQARAMTMKAVAEAIVDPSREGFDESMIHVIGERPGEKMHERLLHHEESVRVVPQKDHFELLPSGSTVEGAKPFTLSSQNPHHWMAPDELRSLIEDAKEI